MVVTLSPGIYMHDFTHRIQMVIIGQFMPIEMSYSFTYSNGAFELTASCM